MLELPEAAVISEQCRSILIGKTIESAVAGHSPHGFAFYEGDPALYGDMLRGKTLRSAEAYGGRVELLADDMVLSFNDGVNLRYLRPEEKEPPKHQFFARFSDGSAFYATVQMYGGLLCFPEGTSDNFYVTVAYEKPSPLTEAFDETYFEKLLSEASPKLSAKAFLATEQRIPGLGNGCLQDILWRSKIHPKRKLSTLSDGELNGLFSELKSTLRCMTDKGGRDTEKDFFGNVGGYITVMSRKNEAGLCPVCGGIIRRLSYLGGNVYVCDGCQKETSAAGSKR